MTTKTHTKPEARKPDYIAKYELARPGDKKRMVSIGVGYDNKDGGVSVLFNAKPLDGFGDKLVLFPFTIAGDTDTSTHDDA